MEVERVDTQKNLIIYRKIKDLKGKHPQEQIKHNIGQRGSHSREWQTVMAWAKVGRRAVFFHNGQASVTGIDEYWYQCFPEGQWWAMSHAEPFLLRTYWGSVNRLTMAVTEVRAGKEAVVPAMVNGPAEQFHLRTGKVHRIRASLKLLDYDPKRDFVALGRGEEPKPQEVVAEAGQKARSDSGENDRLRFYRGININGPALEIDGRRWDGATDVTVKGRKFEDQNATLLPATDEARARMIRSCVYGPGCGVTLRNVPAGMYQVYAYVWEDNAAQTFGLTLNGKRVLSKYNSGAAGTWKRLGPWKTAVRDGTITLANASKADANLSGIEVWWVDEAFTVPVANPGRAVGPKAALSVDRTRRSVTVPCVVAPRKLAHLSEVYPIEVIATWPAPVGQKAHETVVTYQGLQPSDIHAALKQLGLRPGSPARGEGTQAKGPAVRIFLEIPGSNGQSRRVPIEQTLMDRKTGKPIPALKWHFTGSVLRQPDPEKDERVYGADLTGTLIAMFPVTDDVVIQSSLTMKDEPTMKLETDKRVLPEEGTPVKLIIEAGE